MIMEFCPRCETRLVPTSRSRASLYCLKCGHKSPISQRIILKDNSDALRSSNLNMAVLTRKALKLRTLPTSRAYCQECGENKAETWSLAVGSIGVSDIIFYRCVSCRHTWRQAG